jgi:hypothetical protein
MPTHPSPWALQRSHWYANVIGWVPRQVPRLAWMGTALAGAPGTAGRAVFEGRVGVWAYEAPASVVAKAVATIAIVAARPRRMENGRRARFRVAVALIGALLP